MVDLSSKEAIEKATVNDIKQELKNAGLVQSGVKAELVERLWGHVQSKASQGNAPAPENAAQPAQEQQPAAPTSNPEPAPAQQQPAAEQQQAQQDNNANSNSQQEQQPPPSTQPTGEGQKKHEKIVFDDAAARKFEAKKLEVVKPAQPAAPAPAEKKASPPPTALSEAERAKLRAEKFKDPEEARKQNRAERFNISTSETEAERARKRAERFGTDHPDIEAEKTRKRKERFGVEDPQAKLQSRAERFKPLEKPKPPANFGTVLSRDELKARKERQERFNTGGNAAS